MLELIAQELESVMEAELGVAPARVYNELLPILEKRETPFVKKDFKFRTNPFIIMKNCKSIIAVAVSKKSIPEGLKYRDWIRDELKKVVNKLAPERGWKVRVDRGELLERHIAYLAGLGWFGQNNMLCSPRFGNEFYIGIILTDIDQASVPIGKPMESRCTGCGECIKNCPTSCLSSFNIDAEKCLGFQQIDCGKCFCRHFRLQFEKLVN